MDLLSVGIGITYPKCSISVDYVIFDQPWTLSNITAVNDVDYFTKNSTQRYIISDFTFSPGLGNLMFQYASLRSIAEQHNAKLILPSSCTLRRAFTLTAIFATGDVVEKLLELYKKHKKNFQKCCKYYPTSSYKLFQTPTRNIEYLAGYFQSYRFFEGQVGLVRKEFQFLPGVISRAENCIQRAKAERFLEQPAVKTEGDMDDQAIVLDDSDDGDITYIGLHVRKGADLTVERNNIVHGHTTATKSYFQRAMSFFRKKYKKVIFMVVSDNLPWVKVNLRSNIKGEIYVSETHQREVDLATLSLCNHTILSTGTFSWWSGYLAGGDAVYYKNWPREGSDFEKLVEKKDYFPKNWIPME